MRVGVGVTVDRSLQIRNEPTFHIIESFIRFCFVSIAIAAIGI